MTYLESSSERSDTSETSGSVGGAAGAARPARVGSPADTARQCCEVLSRAGPLAALRFLNARTRFRFTGVYRAEPPYLRNLYLFDRENPALNVSGDVSNLDDTFCAIPCIQNGPFGTPNTLRDERLAAHAARERVRSYCGVPIRLDSGCVWGTLCHFDVRPRLVSPSETEVLLLVASGLAPRLIQLVPVS